MSRRRRYSMHSSCKRHRVRWQRRQVLPGLCSRCPSRISHIDCPNKADSATSNPCPSCRFQGRRRVAGCLLVVRPGPRPPVHLAPVTHDPARIRPGLGRCSTCRRILLRHRLRGRRILPHRRLRWRRILLRHRLRGRRILPHRRLRWRWILPHRRLRWRWILPHRRSRARPPLPRHRPRPDLCRLGRRRAACYWRRCSGCPAAHQSSLSGQRDRRQGSRRHCPRHRPCPARSSHLLHLGSGTRSRQDTPGCSRRSGWRHLARTLRRIPP